MYKKKFNRELFQKTFFSNIDKIKKQEHISSDEINSSWEEVEKKTSTPLASPNKVHNKSTIHRRLLFITSVAASLILAFSLTFGYKYNTTSTDSYSMEIQLKELNVPKGKSLEVILSDGTKVYANAGSQILYPSAFSKDRREISIKGEVYLEVAHNPQVPFIVKTNGFDIRVLGTKFNVQAYPNEKSASVVLVQGSVQIETRDKQKALLRPNERAVITSEGTNIHQVDVGKYISWKDHFILLDQEKLGVVLKRLSTYYGMNFHCDPNVANLQLSGKLSLENNTQEVIRILQKTAKLEYMKENNGYRLYKRE